MQSFFYAERVSNSIQLFFSDKQPLPPLPYELQGFVSFAAWESRTRAVRELCVRHTRPALERLWFLFSFLVTLVVPMVVFRVIADQKLRPFDGITYGDLTLEQRKQIYNITLQARAISIGVLAGLVLLFWGPFAVWKALVRRRASALTRAWDAEDRAANPGGVSPTWRIRVPGVFTFNGCLVVTIPPKVPPSMFHPDAYLPAYLQRPPFQSYAPPNDGPRVIPYNGPVDEKHPEDFMDVNLNNNNTQVYRGPFSDAHAAV